MNAGSEKKVEQIIAVAVIFIFALVILASIYVAHRSKKSPPAKASPAVLNKSVTEPQGPTPEPKLAPHFVFPVETIPTDKEIASNLVVQRQKQKVFEALSAEKKKKAEKVRENAEEELATPAVEGKSVTVPRKKTEEEKNEEKRRRSEAIAQINAGRYFMH